MRGNIGSLRDGEPMMLSKAVRVLAAECGVTADELEVVLSAITRTAANRRELVRLMRLIASRYSGRVVLNCDRGSITDTRVDASITELERSGWSLERQTSPEVSLDEKKRE